MNYRRHKFSDKTEKVLFVISLLILCFIWGHSMMPANLSSEESSGLFNLLKPVFDFIFGNDVITHALFRKLAHMSEFCAFCFFLTFLFNAPWQITISFIVACIDESIQIFVSGRGPAFRDVLIDTSGAVIGFLLAMFLLKTLLSEEI